MVSATITVSDLDTTTDANLNSETVTNGSGLMSGDVLAYSGSNAGVVSAYAASTGVLSLSGSIAVSAWQTALRAVTYSSSSEDPTGTQEASDRVVSFVISDGNASSVAVTRTIEFMAVNDVPVLADVEAASLAYTENDAATVVSATITVSDVDTLTDAHLDSATASISTGLTDGDGLAYSGSDGAIRSAYDAGTGVLSMLCAQRARPARVIAIEASEMAAVCRELVAAQGLEGVITVVQARVEDVAELEAAPHGVHVGFITLGSVANTEMPTPDLSVLRTDRNRDRLSRDEMADAVLFMVSRPEGVNVDEMVLTPLQQILWNT